MENKRKNIYYMILAVAVITVLVLLDQWTKSLAVHHLKGTDPFVLIDGVFELDYLENHGAAFGMLQNQQWLFAILTVVFLIFALVVFWKVPKIRRYLPIYWLLIVLTSGAIGNFIDRLVNQYVVDFFSFVLINFPVFNVADIYVTLAGIAFFILAVFYYKDEDYDLLFPKKDKK